MTAYASLIKWALVALVLAALFLGGWHYGAKHVQTAWDVDKAARVTALANAQAQIIVEQAASQAKVIAAQAASQKIAVDYEEKLKDARTASDALTALVYSYEAKLRRAALPEAHPKPHPTGGTADTPALTASDGQADAGAATVDAAAADAIAACAADATQLESLISWVTTVPQ